MKQCSSPGRFSKETETISWCWSIQGWKQLSAERSRLQRKSQSPSWWTEIRGALRPARSWMCRRSSGWKNEEAGYMSCQLSYINCYHLWNNSLLLSFRVLYYLYSTYWKMWAHHSLVCFIKLGQGKALCFSEPQFSYL